VAACGRVGFDAVPGGGDAGSADAPGLDTPVCAAVSSDDWLPSPMPLDADKRYTVSADTTYVTDLVTGLVWQRDPVQQYDLPSATSYCATLTLGGCMQWRVPQRVELTTLIDHAFMGPAIDPNAFPVTPVAGYWSATPQTSANNAWEINFDNGNTFWNPTSTLNDVRCVYGGKAGTLPPARYRAMSGAVVDLETGLTWQQPIDSVTYDQAGAVAHCAAITAPSNGWRLPEAGELETLVDATRTNPAIDPTAFPGALSTIFWTNSPYGGAAFMIVDFATGNTINAVPTDTYNVRCVK
jgi:hypothetical protein